jgi:hypothetical protein
MPQEPRRSSRKKPIEPFDYAVAAQAPALKGMTSFLDVPPEVVRSGNVVSMSRLAVLPLSTVRGPGDDKTPGYISSSADDIPMRAESTVRPHVPELIPDLAQPSVNVVPLAAGEKIDLSVVASHTVHDITTGDEKNLVNERPPRYETSPGGLSYPNTSPFQSTAALVPGRGRSKVRKCVLAQDAHSLGEEAVYQVLWRSGKPESSDPNGTRTIRIGAADIGQRVNMAKKNVRQNIARLFEKLAIEVLETFETVSSLPRLYRVYSYKQILERRRAAGLNYVLRNKGVIFCTADGEEVRTPPGDETSPGGKTSLRPAPSKRSRNKSPVPKFSDQLPAQAGVEQKGATADELRQVAEALNRYWPVDEAAAVQLLRDCRRVRADVRSDEIVFFVSEKLELARSNRNITNPTGLILATVPQSFAGQTFLEFRQRREEQARLAAEEQRRRQEEQEGLREWVRQDRERQEAILNDPTRSQQERDLAEQRLRQMTDWNA